MGKGNNMTLETINNKDFNVIIDSDGDKDILDVLKNKKISIIFKNSDSNIKLNATVEEEDGKTVIKTNYFNMTEVVQF
jgi:hypothetical protein